MAAYSTSKPLNCGIRDEYEDAIPAMDSFQRYSQQYGLPLAIYADQYTIYQSPAEPTVAEQLAGEEPRSQFGRALDELGVELIAAHSPQAKGRVERLFKTVQDQLIKEMRLAGIATLEDSIHFLKHDLPHYNRRFAVAPAQPADLHRPRPTAQVLVRSLCPKTSRCLRKDFTIAHEGRLYQVHDQLRATHVVVEEHLDGTRRSHIRGGYSASTRFHRGPCRRQRARRCLGRNACTAPDFLDTVVAIVDPTCGARHSAIVAPGPTVCVELLATAHRWS